jgi:AcrR family transcriptional regulator
MQQILAFDNIVLQNGAMATAQRAYAGISADERRAQRRAAFLAAATEVAGTRGFAKLTVRALCGEAGLTERYFYENFTDMGALVNAVFDQMVADISAAILARVAQPHKDTRAKMRAGLAAAIETMTDDPRRLRMFTEAEFNPALTQRRSDVVRNFAATLLSVGREHYGPDTIGRTGPRAHFAAMHLIGGLYETMIGWTRGDLPVSRDELIDLATDMLAVVGQHLTDTHPT